MWDIMLLVTFIKLVICILGIDSLRNEKNGKIILLIYLIKIKIYKKVA